MSGVIDFPVRRRLRSCAKVEKQSAKELQTVENVSVAVKSKQKRNLPKESFEENVNCDETPNEKKRRIKRKLTPCFKKNEISRNERLNQYQLAKHLLSASSVSCIIGRESEFRQLQHLIGGHLQSKNSTSIYISGAPGTGKSVCINNVVKLLKNTHSFKFMKMNAMNFRNSNALFSHIADELKLSYSSKTQSVAAIEKFIKQLKQPLLLIVDEIDNLVEKHQEALYTIFDWSRVAAKNVIVVGIANTLDFTSRVLPRFHFLKEQRVKEIHFTPYTKDQIKQIIESRLSSLRCKNLIKPLAVEMIARKVSSHSGDARKALNLCEKAIELLEKEETKQFKETSDDGFNIGSEKSSSNGFSVEISHVMKVLKQVYGGDSGKDSCNDISYLPTQQQIILCICLMFAKFIGQKEVDIKRCYETFGKICSKKGLSYEMCNISDFRSMCDLLESKAFLIIKQIKDTTKIGLKNDENELFNLMNEKPFLANLLKDSSFV
ncbi:hypothetical protein B4U80_13423 [Leptotrombidium deliense]|uniref:Cell division control protein n=1 Tax=Leptotrombidium deliense TaxID=299467 RepID=A0A443S6R9_9ACAR|nr:hypothetical protein B4U80_13423 [Leptotrombidium deliense]